MSLETTHDLSESTLEKVVDLARIQNDSAKGFATVAEAVEDPGVRDLFKTLSGERRRMGRQLAELLAINAEDAPEGGSWQGKAHRWWIEIRGKVSGGDTYAMLAEAERGEDKIKHAYEDALKDTAGSAINDVLLEQYAHVKKGHDRVRDLRDAVKAAEDK